MRTIPNKKATSQLTLRLPGSLHQELKETAAADGWPSLNTYCLYVLGRHDICTAKKRKSK